MGKKESIVWKFFEKIRVILSKDGKETSSSEARCLATNDEGEQCGKTFVGNATRKGHLLSNDVNVSACKCASQVSRKERRNVCRLPLS